MSYAIQVYEVPARVVDFSKRSARVEFFVYESSHHSGRESLAEHLNRKATSFVACRVDGERGLLNVLHIAYVEVLGPSQGLGELDEVGARGEDVTLDLVTDEIVRGRVRYEGREEARLSDLLNSSADRFLLLSDGDRTLYVQRDAIRRVRFVPPRT